MLELLSRLNGRNQNVRAHAPAVICCLGDSVTHGCFEVFLDRKGSIDTVYDSPSGYAAKLEQRLRTLYPVAVANVINAGISGDNAPGGLNRLERDVLSRKPDLVTVNYGLNDAMNQDIEGGLRQYTRAMAEIFDRVLESDAECVLVTPNHMCSYVSHTVTGDLMKNVALEACRVQNEGILTRYVDAARAEAAKRNIPVADAYARWQALAHAGVDTTAMLSNAINHPTREAHGIFVEALMDVFFE